MAKHILLLCIGSHGDVHPFVGLGRELTSRGHDVTLVTSEYFAPLAAKAGLKFIGVGSSEEFLQMAGKPELWEPKRGPLMILDSIADNIAKVHDVVADFIRPDGSSIVVASSLGLGVRIAREHLDFKQVTVHLSPYCFRSSYAPPHMSPPLPTKYMPRFMIDFFWLVADRLVIDRRIGPRLNAFRAKFGLKPMKRFLGNWWHSPDLVAGMFPDWFAPIQPDWPNNVVLPGFPLYDEQDLVPISPALEAFLSAGAAPVAFTPGSAMLHGRTFFETAIDACTRANCRGILLTRHTEQVPANLPAHMIHIDYAPFSLLLPRCSAVVHHGGIGSTAQSLAAGIPQLLMPMAHDQHDNAHRIRNLGVGESVPRAEFTPNRVSTVIGKLLNNPGYRHAAKSVASRVNRPALGELANHIERTHLRE
jgi:UDP:flavonoid glycosyltransferase YjiC (YdhE family)